jgi:hypothetical protein
VGSEGGHSQDEWLADEGLSLIDARLRSPVRFASQYLRPQATAGHDLIQQQFRIDPGFGIPALDVVMVVPKEQAAKEPARHAHAATAALTTALRLIRRAGLPRIMVVQRGTVLFFNQVEDWKKRTVPVLQLVWRHPQKPLERMNEQPTPGRRAEIPRPEAQNPGVARTTTPPLDATGRLAPLCPLPSWRLRFAGWRWDGLTVAWLSSRGPPEGSLSA